MKKLIIILFLSVTGIHSMPAQNIHMTARAGMNFAMISGVGTQIFNHFGAVGGLQFNWQFSKKFSFDPELNYMMKGGRRNPNPDAGDYYSYSIDLDYIEVPTLINWHFHKRDRFTLEFGPTFGFLVRNATYENDLYVQNGPKFNVFDLGLALGFNAHFGKGWGANIRFSNSIMPIQPFSAPPQPVGNVVIGQLNSVLSICVMYSFGFKKKEVSKAIDPLLKKEKKVKTPRQKKPKGDIYDED